MTDCIPDVVPVVGHIGSLALAALGIREGRALSAHGWHVKNYEVTEHYHLI